MNCENEKRQKKMRESDCEFNYCDCSRVRKRDQSKMLVGFAESRLNTAMIYGRSIETKAWAIICGLIGSRASRSWARSNKESWWREPAQLMVLALNKRDGGFCTMSLMFAIRKAECALLFSRLKIKAKVPRPRNKKAVAEEQTAYKKTLPRE